MVEAPIRLTRRHASEKPIVRLLDWARLANGCLDTTGQCGSFSSLFGARTILEHARIAAGDDCELRDVPFGGAALLIELPKRLGNGHPLPAYFVVSVTQHLTAAAMMIEVAPGVARFVLLGSFQYLVALKRQGVSPPQAVAALYETLHSAATAEDRDRFVRFITALERFHRTELLLHFVPFTAP